MCNFKSGIILKNRVVLAPDGNESHFDLLESLGIEDSTDNAYRVFVRAELTPENYNKALPVEEWRYKVDQDMVPDWYEEDPAKYEQEFRDAVKDYLKDQNLESICKYAWTSIKDEDTGFTYHFMDGFLCRSDFGNDNNYANSKIRKCLNDSDFAKELKETFGNKLVTITTDLFSLDGLDDYGTVEGDVLAIPTLDLYRKFRKNLPKISDWWWLATPYSTPSGYSSNGVGCVVGSDGVDYVWYFSIGGVRPFFITQS